MRANRNGFGRIVLFRKAGYNFFNRYAQGEKTMKKKVERRQEEITQLVLQNKQISVRKLAQQLSFGDNFSGH